MNARHRTLLLLPALAGLAVACSSEASVGGGSTSSTSSVAVDSTSTTAVDSSTSAPSSSVEPTASTAVPTTAPAPTAAPTTAPASAFLLSTGIGTATFGDTDDVVVPYLSGAFGGIATDSSATFPVNVGVDQWQNADGDLEYTAQYQRTVCFSNALCASFGGPSTADLRFTGWWIDEARAPFAETTEGIRIGDTWASHLGDIARRAGGCYSYGYGDTAGGIFLGMSSSGEMFNYYDDSTSTWLDGNPDPALVTVAYMEAGDLVRFLYDDC